MDFLDKTCRSNTGKVNTTTEFCIFELVYNLGQNTWNKVKKSSKTGQDWKTFACFFDCHFQSLISGALGYVFTQI